jgi:hypothetical protein
LLYSGILFISASFLDDKDNIFGGFATDSWRPGKFYYVLTRRYYVKLDVLLLFTYCARLKKTQTQLFFSLKNLLSKQKKFMLNRNIKIFWFICSGILLVTVYFCFVVVDIRDIFV